MEGVCRSRDYYEIIEQFDSHILGLACIIREYLFRKGCAYPVCHYQDLDLHQENVMSEVSGLSSMYSGAMMAAENGSRQKRKGHSNLGKTSLLGLY